MLLLPLIYITRTSDIDLHCFLFLLFEAIISILELSSDIKTHIFYDVVEKLYVILSKAFAKHNYNV